MRHAAGELADGVHLLRLIELLARRFQALLPFAPLGDVARDLGEADDIALRVADAVDDNAGPEPGAVLAHAPALGLVPAFARRGRQRAGRDLFGVIFRGVEFRKMPADDLVFAYSP